MSELWTAAVMVCCKVSLFRWTSITIVHGLDVRTIRLRESAFVSQLRVPQYLPVIEEGRLQ